MVSSLRTVLYRTLVLHRESTPCMVRTSFDDDHRNEPTNDHVGPMTQTLLDNALLLQAIAGTDNIDDRSNGSPKPENLPQYYSKLLFLPTPQDLGGIRIGIIKESLDMPGMDPRVLASFKLSVEKFRLLGATIEEISIPMHKHGAAIWTGISKAGGAAAKMGQAFGRRGYMLNDLGAKLWPLTQKSWDKMYPR
jgi:amidase